MPLNNQQKKCASLFWIIMLIVGNASAQSETFKQISKFKINLLSAFFNNLNIASNIKFLPKIMFDRCSSRDGFTVGIQF